MSVGLALIMKPTYACNAACDYCSIHKLGDTVRPMSKDDFSELTDALDAFFKTKSGKSAVTFFWLGGEPLMMSDKFYTHVEEQSKHSALSKSTKIYHNLQSNLTTLAKKDAPAMKRLLKNFSKHPHDGRYHVSTSFDPVSDARVMKSSESYDELFMKGYFHLKKDGAILSAVYTVHKGSIGRARDIYTFFKNLGLDGFNINAMSDYQGEFSEENLEMTPTSYGEFLIDMWKVWAEDNYSLRITPFVSWRRLKERGDDSLLRCHNDGRCNLSLFAIGPNGDVFDCDRAMQAYEKPLGNFKTHSFDEMQSKKVFQDRIVDIKKKQCDGCVWWNYCKGGCPYESRGQFNGYFDKTHWCESFKMLFGYICKV